METEPVFNLKSAVSSPPAGYRFPREVIAVAVRWYLRYGLSYRDVEELLAERGIEVDHVTIYRWVQTFTAEFIDAARPARHAAGDRWFVDEVRHEALWIRVGVRDLHRRAVAAERLQLGVSLIRETPGRVGAALTTTGQVGTARRPGPG
jgi:transposase-like protein